MRTIALPLAAGLALFAVAASLSFQLSAAHLARPYDVLHVPSASTARLAALGHRTFISDLYWLSAVQYIGESKADQRGWEHLFPLIDLVTDLDPRHGYAYQTGGIVLSTAGWLAASDAILMKGMERGPNWWTYPYYIAFNHWFYLGDYATAARYAEMAARRPGASANISHLAVSLASKSGTPEDAVAMLDELRVEVRDEVTAARLDEQLKLATLERDAQMLERAAVHFRAQRSRGIANLNELVSAGIVLEIPPDPFGGEYVWDASEGKVHSSANAFRFKLREGAHAPQFKYRPPGAAAPSPAPGSGVLK